MERYNSPCSLALQAHLNGLFGLPSSAQLGSQRGVLKFLEEFNDWHVQHTDQRIKRSQSDVLNSSFVLTT